MQQLPTTRPFDGGAVLEFLAARAIPGVEVVRDGTYRRTVALAHGDATLALTPGPGGVDLEATALHPADRAAAAALGRAVFGLDQDAAAVARHFAADPVVGPLVAARPGLRVPGAVNGFELAVRAILGQQISVAAARVLAGRIVGRLGAPSPDGDSELTHLFPTPAAIAAAPPDAFPMPRSRLRTLQGLAAADPVLRVPGDADALTALWGIGPWTAAYVALRLGDPDVFLATDVAILRALERLGATIADAPRWAPMRSFATVHLWTSLRNPRTTGP